MDNLNIIYVDDQREVLSTLSKDLQVFEKLLSVEECESADEAFDLINEIDKAGDHLAIIISDYIISIKLNPKLLTIHVTFSNDVEMHLKKNVHTLFLIFKENNNRLLQMT